MLDMASLCRLSPLFAANLATNPLFNHLANPLMANLKMDFKQQLDILAERRAMFEKFKSEIESREGSSTVAEGAGAPIDLSCK